MLHNLVSFPSHLPILLWVSQYQLFFQSSFQVLPFFMKPSLVIPLSSITSSFPSLLLYYTFIDLSLLNICPISSTINSLKMRIVSTTSLSFYNAQCKFQRISLIHLNEIICVTRYVCYSLFNGY